MRAWHAALIVCTVLLALFSVYVWTLFGQLDEAFNQQTEYVPTRIYSDAVRIAPPLPKNYIVNRLHRLGYEFVDDGRDISFELHTTDAAPARNGTKIRLTFDREDKNALLETVWEGDRETREVFLEPELVATLSRPSDGAGDRPIRQHIPLEEMPAELWKAIIAVEDQYYLEHSGLDPRGLLRALWVDLKTLSFAQGGSTITQQLVKNLMARRGKSLFRKFSEIILAIALESSYEKEEILERYLNEVYLGQIGNFEVHGVAEGAKYFFGKKIDQLNMAEIALMAGIIRGPSYYSPYRHLDRTMERQKIVLQKMVETGLIAPEEAEAAQAQPIRLVPPSTETNKAPYFVDFVKAELLRRLEGRLTEEEITESGLRVYTTVDPYLNEIAQTQVESGVGTLESTFTHKPQDMRLEGSLVSVDHKTGKILALCGGRDYGQSTFNRLLNMKRQAGSTFKPIIYLAAMQKGTDAHEIPYGPGYPVLDGPWTWTYENKQWSPKNYENSYSGWIPLKKALALSINIAAARVGQDVGLANIIQTARDLGITSELSELPSLSLGSAEVAPIELLTAYATLANGGKFMEPHTVRAVTDDEGTSVLLPPVEQRQAIEPEFAELMRYLLEGVFKEGTARSAASYGFMRAAAGKTGTTNDYRDAWFAGYTPDLTTLVWVGWDRDIAQELRLSGAVAALPIWVGFMKKASEPWPPVLFPVDEYLTDVRIDLHSGLRALDTCPSSQVITEKYIAGREPQVMACESEWPQH